jgi:hypothetical protein
MLHAADFYSPALDTKVFATGLRSSILLFPVLERNPYHTRRSVTGLKAHPRFGIDLKTRFTYVRPWTVLHRTQFLIDQFLPTNARSLRS